MGSVIFMTGFNSGSTCCTKSGADASSAIMRTAGRTKGTMCGFTNSLARHGTTRCRATLCGSLGRMEGRPWKEAVKH